MNLMLALLIVVAIFTGARGEEKKEEEEDDGEIYVPVAIAAKIRKEEPPPPVVIGSSEDTPESVCEFARSRVFFATDKWARVCAKWLCPGQCVASEAKFLGHDYSNWPDWEQTRSIIGDLFKKYGREKVNQLTDIAKANCAGTIAQRPGVKYGRRPKREVQACPSSTALVECLKTKVMQGCVEALSKP